MIAQKLEGFGENIITFLGKDECVPTNPISFKSTYLKDIFYTPTSIGGKILQAAGQFKYLIIVHEKVDGGANTYINMLAKTYREDSNIADIVSRISGKTYTISLHPNYRNTQAVKLNDTDGRVMHPLFIAGLNPSNVPPSTNPNSFTRAGYFVAVFDLTKEREFDFIEYKYEKTSGSSLPISPTISFFGTNDESYNFFSEDNPDTARLVKVDGLQNLGTEATLQAVLSACQNIKISADSVNLNVDQVEAKLDTVVSKLEDVKIIQTNKTQFTKITDGTDDLAINPDGSINVAGSFGGKNATLLRTINVNTAKSPIANSKNYSGILVVIKSSVPTVTISGTLFVTGMQLGVASPYLYDLAMPFYRINANAVNMNILPLDYSSSYFANLPFNTPKTHILYYPNPLGEDLSVQVSTLASFGLDVKIYGVNFDINQLLPKSTAIAGIVETTSQQINPITKYTIARTDSANAVKYFGFVDKDGNYYIMKQDTSLAVETFTYAIGTNFIADWANRATLTYQEFNDVF